jgi:hypothetical protein
MIVARLRLHVGILAQIDHRHQGAAQADHALDRFRHFRRGGDRRRAHHLAHLEDVDAESLLAPGAAVGAEREQQQFQLVGARQLGARIDVLHQIDMVHFLCMATSILNQATP